MKNLFSIAAIIFIISAGLGCSFLGNSSEPANGSKAANANSAVKKIGVPECDALMDELATFANNPDDNFAVRAGKGIIADQIKQSINSAIEENGANKPQLAEACRSIKAEFEKARTTPSGGSAN